MANDSILIQVQLGSPTRANINAVTKQIQNSLSNVSANVQIKNGRQATQTLQNIKKGTDAAKGSMTTFGEAIGLSARRFVAFTSAVAVVGRLTSALSQATREAIKFEREFVKLAQVFDTDVRALGALQKSMSDLSREFGLSATVIAKTSVVLAQSGLNARETREAMQTLAKTTLAATFDSIASSAEGAVAIMAQFGTSADKLEAQLGAINAVSKRFAVESGDIIEAVRRAGGAFQAAGGNLNDFIALFTAVRSTTRESAETIATGFRTIFSRLQRPKTIDFFRQLNIELTDGRGNFIGAFEAVRRLSKGLEEAGIRAGSIKFAGVVEQLGGIRQVSRVIPLLGQFAKAERARQVAVAGAGSLDKDAAKAQGTLAQAFARTTENFRALIREITQTGTFQAFVKIGLSMANAFIEAARAIKPLIPLLAAMAAIKLGGLFSGAIRKGFGASPAKDVVQAANKGGKILGFNRGGTVPGTGNGDTVPAMLEPGEFVIRKRAVKAYGKERLSKINKYAVGGTVEATGKEINGLYKTINAKEDKTYTATIIPNQYSAKSDFLMARMMASARRNPNYPSKTKTWELFEDAVADSNNLKHDKTPSAFLDYPARPGDAKFLKEDKTYSANDNRGNNKITYLAKVIGAGEYKDNVNIGAYFTNEPSSMAAVVKKYSIGKDKDKTKYGRADITKFAKGGKAEREYGGINLTGSGSSVVATYGDGPATGEVNAVPSASNPSLFTVASSSATKGYGPRLYDAVMEKVTQLGGQLTSDRSRVSRDAERVWKYYLTKRPDVQKTPLSTKDWYSGPLFDQKKFASEDPKTWPPHSDESWALLTGYSKSPSLIKDSKKVKHFAEGGPAGTDTVPALLTPGEFVINKKSAEAFGYNGLEKINKYASGGPVGVQKFVGGGAAGFNRSELYLKQILDQLKRMESVGGGGGGGGDFQKETDDNTKSIKQESEEREKLTKTVADSFDAQSKYSVALTGATVGLSVFASSFGEQGQILSEALATTSVKFSVFNGAMAVGQGAALKIAAGFEKIGINNPADALEKLKGKAEGAGKNIKEMFKSKGTKAKEKTAGILDEVRKGGAVGSKTDGAKPTGAKEEIIKSATIQIKQAEIKVDGQKGAEKEKFKMGEMASKPPETYGLRPPETDTYGLKPPTNKPKTEETPSGRKRRRIGETQDRNNPLNRKPGRAPKLPKGVKGASKAIKGLGKVAKMAKAAASAMNILGSVAKIGTAAVGLLAAGLSTIAQMEAKIAEERKENAIKEGNVQEAVAAKQEQTAKEFESQAVSVGASAGGAIGTVVGALLIPILGPLGPIVGGLIGSVVGLMAGMAASKESMYALADGAREGVTFLITGLNAIINGINDFFLTPLSDAINYIYSWITGETLDVNIELPKVSDEIAAMLISMIPDPELTDRLANAQVAHEAGLVKYTKTQEAATKSIEGTLKAFGLAGDAATKTALLGEALDGATGMLTSFETSGEGGGSYAATTNLISREDIEAKRKEVTAKKEKAKGGASRTGLEPDTAQILAMNREAEMAAQQLGHMEEKLKLQNEAIDKSIGFFGETFAAARGANLLSQAIKKANTVYDKNGEAVRSSTLQINAAGVITKNSIEKGSILDRQLQARIKAGATEEQALAAMTVQIFGATGALGNLKDATQKAYETIGSELKTLAFGSDEQQAASAQKVAASAAVASGSVKLNDLDQEAKEGAMSFLPALANAGITDFGGGNIMESLTANVADTIPGFDQIGDTAAARVMASEGGTPEQAAAAKKEEQDRLVKAMFGIDDTAAKQLEAAKASVAELTSINENTKKSKEENTEKAVAEEGENGKKAEGEEGGKKASENALQIQELPKTPEQVQASVLDEAKKQTVLLAAILAKPVGAGGGGGGQQSGMMRDVNDVYDNTVGRYTGMARGAISGVSSFFGQEKDPNDDGSGMRIGDLFGGEGQAARKKRIAGERSQAKSREKYGTATSEGFTGKPSAVPAAPDLNVQAILASLPTGGGGGGGVGGSIVSPDLIEAANKIKEASEIFPKEIIMSLGDTSVNVNINGAEVLNAIMPEVKSLVMGSVVNELVNFEKTKDQNSSPGSYANNKKAEQYAV